MKNQCEKCKCNNIKDTAACRFGKKVKADGVTRLTARTKSLDLDMPPDLYATIEHIAESHGLTIEETIQAFLEKAVNVTPSVSMAKKRAASASVKAKSRKKVKA